MLPGPRVRTASHRTLRTEYCTAGRESRRTMVAPAGMYSLCRCPVGLPAGRARLAYRAVCCGGDMEGVVPVGDVTAAASVDRGTSRDCDDGTGPVRW